MDNTERAWEFFERAVERQMAGDFEVAIQLYTQSIDAKPTAEAFTYRGWTHSYMGRVDLAIADCKRAIEVDPEFGNPYNDIGAYLIELDQHDEAIPWLEKAISAPRYDERQFPWANLARIHEVAGRLTQALRHYRRALEASPGYLPALIGAKRMLGRLN